MPIRMPDKACPRCGTREAGRRYVVVCAERHNRPTSRGQQRVQHLSYVCASEEAGRLSENAPGCAYWVVEILLAAITPKPVKQATSYYTPM